MKFIEEIMLGSFVLIFVFAFVAAMASEYKEDPLARWVAAGASCGFVASVLWFMGSFVYGVAKFLGV